MDLKEVLFSLAEADGASGNESPAAEKALKLLCEYCPDAKIVEGNVIGTFGNHKEGLPLLVLDAHIDQVGFVVTYITDEGFIKIGSIGGIEVLAMVERGRVGVVTGESEVPVEWEVQFGGEGELCAVVMYLLQVGGLPVAFGIGRP